MFSSFLTQSNTQKTKSNKSMKDKRVQSIKQFALQTGGPRTHIKKTKKTKKKPSFVAQACNLRTRKAVTGFLGLLHSQHSL